MQQENERFTVLSAVRPGPAIEIWVLPKTGVVIDASVTRLEATVIVDFTAGPAGAQIIARGQINAGQGGLAIIDVPTEALSIKGVSKIQFYHEDAVETFVIA